MKRWEREPLTPVETDAVIELIAETVYEDSRIDDVSILFDHTISIRTEDGTIFIVSVEKVST